MDDLEQLLHQQWRALYGAKVSNHATHDNEDEDEVALFSGTCFNCGETGHKKTDCKNPSKPKSKKASFKGKCNRCGKQGHKAEDCWDDPKNAGKRPKNWKSKAANETGAAAIDVGPTVEYQLAEVDSGMTLVASHKGLSGPSLWIADSAATVHSTPHAMDWSM